jgi:hypothetical protein
MPIRGGEEGIKKSELENQEIVQIIFELINIDIINN